MLGFFPPPRRPPSGVSPGASVAPDCRMGRGVSIGAFVTVAEGCEVGDRVILMPGVTLGTSVKIGEDSVLFPSVTVGDGCVLRSRGMVHAGSVVGDRKSTRLNSSHLGISYAAFCLKKKQTRLTRN